jgi:hypothetical protein
MYVATLSERDLPVLASERCPYSYLASAIALKCTGHNSQLKNILRIFARLIASITGNLISAISTRYE